LVWDPFEEEGRRNFERVCRVCHSTHSLPLFAFFYFILHIKNYHYLLIYLTSRVYLVPIKDQHRGPTTTRTRKMNLREKSLLDVPYFWAVDGTEHKMMDILQAE
jgi:hypothetical protein